MERDRLPASGGRRGGCRRGRDRSGIGELARSEGLRRAGAARRAADRGAVACRAGRRRLSECDSATPVGRAADGCRTRAARRFASRRRSRAPPCASMRHHVAACTSVPGSTQRLRMASNRPASTRAEAAHRLALARLLELQVAARGRASLPPACAFCDPARRSRRALRPWNLKRMSREAGAAVVGREALVVARLVDHGVQLRLHARHGVDHAGQRRDVERVHHRRRGDLEARSAGRPAPPAR